MIRAFAEGLAITLILAAALAWCTGDPKPRQTSNAGDAICKPFKTCKT